MTNPNSLGITANYILHARAKAGIPFAKEMLDAFEALPTTGNVFTKADLAVTALMLHARYAFITCEVRAEKPSNILELGAGFSTNSFVLAPEGYRCLNLDLPQKIMERNKAVCNLSLPKAALQITNAPADVCNTDAVIQLVDCHFDTGKIAVVVEGLLPHLPVKERAQVLTTVREAILHRGNGGVGLLTDIHTRQSLRAMNSLAGNTLAMMDRVKKVTGHDIYGSAFESDAARKSLFDDCKLNAQMVSLADYCGDNLIWAENHGFTPDLARNILAAIPCAIVRPA